MFRSGVKRKFLIVLLVVVMLLTMTSSSFASSDPYSDWTIRYTYYGSAAGEAATALGVASILSAAAQYGPASLFLGVASLIVLSSGDFFNAYYKKEILFSPGGYSYVIKTTWYENPNYTGQIGDPVYSDIYYSFAPAQ